MEVEPRYWQDPSVLNDIYVSISGENPSGSSQSNLPGGTVVRAQPASVALSSANDTARNAETNALANVGNSSATAGTAVSAASETMVQLSAIVHFKPGKTALNVNHQCLFVASTISFTVAGRAAVAQG